MFDFGFCSDMNLCLLACLLVVCCWNEIMMNHLQSNKQTNNLAQLTVTSKEASDELTLFIYVDLLFT